MVDASAEAARLRAAVAAVDLTCGGHLPREDAELLLGERAQLAEDAGWLDAIAWREIPGDADIGPAERADGAVEGGEPGARALEAYVTRGDLASWVERAAGRSSEIAETLEAMIATYREGLAPVSFVARRWQRDRAQRSAPPGATRAPLSFLAPARDLRRAAADASPLPVAAGARQELGRLEPLDAEARLLIAEHEITLEVFEGRDAITRVQLGDADATRGTDGGPWRVTIARSEEELALLVVDAAGRRV